MFLTMAALVALKVAVVREPDAHFGAWTLRTKLDDFDGVTHCALSLETPAGKLAAVSGPVSNAKLGVAGFRDTSAAEYKLDDAVPVGWALKAITADPDDSNVPRMARAGVVVIDLSELKGHNALKIRRSAGEDTIGLDIKGLDDTLQVVAQ